MTIDRTEIRFTYWFGVLFVLHACGLIYLASHPFPINDYESSCLKVTAQLTNSVYPGLISTMQGEELFPISPLSHFLSAAGHWLISDLYIGFRLLHIFIYLAAFVGFYYLVKLYIDVRTAFYSCCIAASSILLNWQMHIATPEGLAAVFMCAALFFFFHFLKTNQKKLLWYLYGSLALAFLTKGLVTLILSLLVMVLFLMFRIKMNGDHLEKMKLGKGLLFTFIIALPWYIFTAIINNENWLFRFFDTIYWQQYYGPASIAKEGAFYFPFIFIILSLLPFGFFLPKSFGYSWKIRQKKPLLLLSTLSLLVILVFYAFSESFHLHYLLPAIPFASIIIAYQLSQLNGRALEKTKLYIGIGGTILLAIALPVVLYIFQAEGEIEGIKWVITFMIGLLPVGTFLSFALWKFKRTDDAVAVLSLTYFIFMLFLVHISRESAPFLL